MRRLIGIGTAATLLAVAVTLAGCGDSTEPGSENYGNLLNSPGGLIVLQEEHPTGWQRPDCFGCHNVLTMHTVNRTGLPMCVTPPATPTSACIDLLQIQEIIDNQGESSCAMCHGDNGVEQ